MMDSDKFDPLKRIKDDLREVAQKLVDEVDKSTSALAEMSRSIVDSMMPESYWHEEMERIHKEYVEKKAKNMEEVIDPSLSLLLFRVKEAGKLKTVTTPLPEFPQSAGSREIYLRHVGEMTANEKMETLAIVFSGEGKMPSSLGEKHVCATHIYTMDGRMRAIATELPSMKQHPPVDLPAGGDEVENRTMLKQFFIGFVNAYKI